MTKTTKELRDYLRSVYEGGLYDEATVTVKTLLDLIADSEALAEAESRDVNQLLRCPCCNNAGIVLNVGRWWCPLCSSVSPYVGQSPIASLLAWHKECQSPTF